MVGLHTNCKKCRPHVKITQCVKCITTVDVKIVCELFYDGFIRSPFKCYTVLHVYLFYVLKDLHSKFIYSEGF